MASMWRIGIVKDRSKPMLGLHGHHLAFRGLPGVEIAALADSRSEGSEEILALTGAARLYPTFEEMLQGEKLDVVVLCSRHPRDHFPQIVQAARRGIHVYTEKPMTSSLEEADRIVELVQRSGIKLLAAHFGRYSPAFRTMKRLIACGEIGRPLTVYGKGKCDHRGGGEDLIVLGTHILDLQTFLFGEPISVQADISGGGRPIVRLDRAETIEPIGPAAGDSILAVFNFSGGVRGIFESRRGLPVEGGRVHMGLTVQGTRGALSLRFCDGLPEDALRLSRMPGPVEDGSNYETVPLLEDGDIPGAEPLDYSLCGLPDTCRASWILAANRFAAWDLLRSIEEGRQPEANAVTARLALEMIYAIYESHLSGRRVPFPLPQRAHPLGEDDGAEGPKESSP